MQIKLHKDERAMDYILQNIFCKSWTIEASIGRSKKGHDQNSVSSRGETAHETYFQMYMMQYRMQYMMQYMQKHNLFKKVGELFVISSIWFTSKQEISPNQMSQLIRWGLIEFFLRCGRYVQTVWYLNSKQSTDCGKNKFKEWYFCFPFYPNPSVWF